MQTENGSPRAQEQTESEVELSSPLHACLVYVEATQGSLEKVRTILGDCNYSVTEFMLGSRDQSSNQIQDADTQTKLKKCIEGAKLIVILLPESPSNDHGIAKTADIANQLGKRIVGIVSGSRINYPAQIDDYAHSMLRNDSEHIAAAICGDELWEKPDQTEVEEREIVHIRCQ